MAQYQDIQKAAPQVEWSGVNGLIENVREELDAPGEWFHDRATQTLHYFPPAGLDLGTPLNFVSTADTYGGNSGSPAVTKDLRIVGLNFDRNINALVRDYIYLPERGRNVMVDVRAVPLASGEGAVPLGLSEPRGDCVGDHAWRLRNWSTTRRRAICSSQPLNEPNRGSYSKLGIWRATARTVSCTRSWASASGKPALPPGNSRPAPARASR